VRRILAGGGFGEAKKLAKSVGLVLVKHSPVHYALRQKGKGGWILNIYPGNRRLYHDRKRPKPPYLDLPEKWTLRDVVAAAASQGVFSRKVAQTAPQTPPERSPEVGDFDIATFCKTHGAVVRQLTEDDISDLSELETPEFAAFDATCGPG